MARIILITGGCRSGKSGFAQQMAERLADDRLFVATCPVTDPEMERRIERHQRDRQVGGWLTAEEPVDLLASLDRHAGIGVILIDCLTLWINNLMYEAERAGGIADESLIEEKIDMLLRACRELTGDIIMVTNEVGLGIVPENRQARLFRDLVGRCNQCVAARADEVYLVSCGIPLQLKGKTTTAGRDE